MGAVAAAVMRGVALEGSAVVVGHAQCRVVSVL